MTVEDNGAGIQDLCNALTLAGKDKRESPLNEHGYGLKHALAFFDSNNSNYTWELHTRTAEDSKFNRYACVVPPYDFDGINAGYEDGWDGTLDNTGTLIRFTCPMSVFATLAPESIKGKPTFAELVSILGEHLSYTYATVLRQQEMLISLYWADGASNGGGYLPPLLPEWEAGTLVEKPAQVIKLGSNEETISCRYGVIRPDKNAHCYYKGNMESSGAEIRINGRVVATGLVKEIWGRARHNSLNTFLAQIDICGNGFDAFPETKTAKNGLRLEKQKTIKLFQWIRATVTLPAKESKEHQLRDKLAQLKNAEDGVTNVVCKKHMYTSKGMKIPVDLFVSRAEKVTLYECKYKNTTALNAQQLRMYWNGAVYDGYQVEEAILIAQHHPCDVQRMIDTLNQEYDPEGRHYNFRLATWAEEGIAC